MWTNVIWLASYVSTISKIFINVFRLHKYKKPTLINFSDLFIVDRVLKGKVPVRVHKN